jgi:hypothetical protein
MHLQRDLVVYLLDERSLDADQCYIVICFGVTYYFSNKSKLEKYLVSLDPKFQYIFLGELASHLIENEIVVDVSMTNCIGVYME